MSDEKIVAALQKLHDGEGQPGVFEEKGTSTYSVIC
jgi:hypothetical protein